MNKKVIVSNFGAFGCALNFIAFFVGFITGGHTGPPLQIDILHNNKLYGFAISGRYADLPLQPFDYFF